MLHFFQKQQIKPIITTTKRKCVCLCVRVLPTCCASLYNMRALTAVVCVRRMFFWASSIFQLYLYLKAKIMLDHLTKGFVDPALECVVIMLSLYLTPVNHSLPLSGPS